MASSNVPGPTEQLYLLGRPMVEVLAGGPYRAAAECAGGRPAADGRTARRRAPTPQPVAHRG